MLLAEIKDFLVLPDNKAFSERLIKIKKESYEKLNKVARIDDYAIENLLHYSYHQKDYKCIGIDLSKKKKYDYSPNKLISQEN